MADSYCSDCKKCTEVVFDHSAGDTVCLECGLVLEAHSIDETSEWRTFANESGDNDPVRVGGPSNPLLTDGGLSTVISKPKGAQGDFLSSSLGRWQNRGANPDRSLIIAFRTIATMSDRLGLVATIKDRANEIYKKVEDLKSIRGRNLDAILAACLYIACRQEDRPRTVKEICSVANGATKKEIGRAKEYIVKQLEFEMGKSMEMGTIHAGDFLRRFCSHLGMNNQAVKAAQEAVQKSEELDIRRSPISIAAAVIYMIAQLSEDKKLLRDISLATGVAEGSSMDTPLSMRRITRSQAVLNSHKKIQDEAISVEKGRRSVLLDITNDSPIVGLASGSIKTPASSLPSGRRAPKLIKTPGSGEELLRGQVKDLLQKVDEETEVIKPMLSNDDKFINTVAPFRTLLGHLLQAPTPTNTPQILDLSAFEGESDGKLTSQVSSTEAVLYQGECQLKRALLFDSPEKSGMSVSSGLTSHEVSSTSIFSEKVSDDDSSSIWSVQANANSEKDDIDEEEEYELEEDDLDVEHYNNENLFLDDLCDGFRKISMVEEGKSVGLPEFTGKHTRFVYNANDEIEEVIVEVKPASSPNVVVLKGIPAPEGKHIRFCDEEE